MHELENGIESQSSDMTFGFGTLGFLILSSPGGTDAARAQEWSNVTLKDAAVSEGYIVKIFPNEFIKIYNAEDEVMHRETMDKVVGVKSEFTLNLFQ